MLFLVDEKNLLSVPGNSAKLYTTVALSHSIACGILWEYFSSCNFSIFSRISRTHTTVKPVRTFSLALSLLRKSQQQQFYFPFLSAFPFCVFLPFLFWLQENLCIFLRKNEKNFNNTFFCCFYLGRKLNFSIKSFPSLVRQTSIFSQYNVCFVAAFPFFNAAFKHNGQSVIHNNWLQDT